MCKKLIYFVSFVLVLSLVGDVQAATMTWTDAGPDDLWSTLTNWDSGTVPTSNDKAQISMLPGAIIANEGAVAKEVRIGVGDVGATGALTVDGGTLTEVRWFNIAHSNGTNGTLNMNSGAITVSDTLNVGRGGSSTLNMNGGTITVTGDFQIALNAESTGHVNLDGGIINAGNFVMRSKAGAVGTMDVRGGTLIIDGDQFSTVQGYIDDPNGWITAYGGDGTLLLDYDVTNEGKTTLTAFKRILIVDPNGDIAAANAMAEAGDAIEIAEGTYYLTSQIEIKSGVTYRGAGPGPTIIDGNDVTRAFVAWGDRGATDGQVDANGVGLTNLTGPTGWVLDGLTIQNCVSDANNRQDILGAARDLLNNYTGTPYTLATAQGENGGIEDNPGWFEVLSGGADDNLTDVELQAYFDANPPGSAGHLVVNDDKRDDGGAVCILNGADGTIRNCDFSNNTADDDGGAVLILNDTAGTIRNCTFSTNAADDDGGAIMLDGVGIDVAIDNCAFDLNTCGDEGGAMKLSGNASIYTITDTNIAGSYADDDGGAIRADGDDSSYVLTDCTLIGNYAGDDGAVVRYGPDRAELTVTNCAFIGNGKDPNGTVVGDFSVWSTHDDDAGPMTFMNCLFADNACNDDRFIELKAAFALLNCTFIGNVAGDKPMIAVRGRAWDSTGDGEDDVVTDDSIISNCLFINNTMLSDGNVIGDTRDNVFAPTVTNCLFFGNLDGTDPANNTNDDSPEVGTIDVSTVTDAAQLVVDPAGDYHLVAGSAAIDASDPATATATDIEGTPAVGVRDVGAYEFVAP